MVKRTNLEELPPPRVSSERGDGAMSALRHRCHSHVTSSPSLPIRRAKKGFLKTYLGPSVPYK